MKVILIAAALAAIAAPAFAGGPWTATPAQPSTKTNIVTGAVIWDCGATGCHTTSDTSDADSMTACRGLAHEVGALSAFTFDGGAFDAARLGRCNASAHKA